MNVHIGSNSLIMILMCGMISVEDTDSENWGYFFFGPAQLIGYCLQLNIHATIESIAAMYIG